MWRNVKAFAFGLPDADNVRARSARVTGLHGVRRGRGNPLPPLHEQPNADMSDPEDAELRRAG
jgi:hypothetical protein